MKKLLLWFLFSSAVLIVSAQEKGGRERDYFIEKSEFDFICNNLITTYTTLDSIRLPSISEAEHVVILMYEAGVVVFIRYSPDGTFFTLFKHPKSSWSTTLSTLELAQCVLATEPSEGVRLIKYSPTNQYR